MNENTSFYRTDVRIVQMLRLLQDHAAFELGLSSND
jgi:hypothetical protein